MRVAAIGGTKCSYGILKGTRRPETEGFTVMSEQWHHGTYAEHAQALIRRGMDIGLANELRWCGNPALVIEAERATDAQIAEMNAAYRARAESPS